MTRALVAAIALVGFGITSAHAQDTTVHRTAPSGGVVLRDTITGGLVGTAVSGGIILYEMVIKDDSTYDWGKTLGWGAVIGLGAGLVFGVVDATSRSYADRTIASAHDGLSRSLDVAPHDQSGKAEFPVVLRTF